MKHQLTLWDHITLVVKLFEAFVAMVTGFVAAVLGLLSAAIVFVVSLGWIAVILFIVIVVLLQ